MCCICVGVYNQFNFHKLTYYFCGKEIMAPPAKNGFAVLMQSQHEGRLPAKVKGDKLHGDQRMFIDVVNMLGAMFSEAVLS